VIDERAQKPNVCCNFVVYKFKLNMKALLAFLMIVLFTQPILAQDSAAVEAMRADGKIWVVVSIILVILIGLFLYLFNTDRKISNIEKELKK
jgi:CcmD family protein